MSNEAPFDQQSPEALKALAKVVPMCLPGWPCKRSSCKTCRKELAWNNALEQADMDFESQIWGEVD